MPQEDLMHMREVYVEASKSQFESKLFENIKVKADGDIYEIYCLFEGANQKVKRSIKNFDDFEQAL